MRDNGNNKPVEATRPELFTCTNLSVGWHGRALLPPIDLTVRQGDFWAVIGRNGSGKTTWFKTLLGLIPAVGGTLRWHRPDLPIAYIPQRGEVDLLFPATTFEVVAMGTERNRSYLGPLRARAQIDQTRLALEHCDATALSGLAFRELSEGQKQRVMLARAVASQPELALFDEPTASMDVQAEEETLALIDRLRGHYGMAVIIVSHFLGVAARFAEQVLLVDKERQLVRVGPPEQVMGEADFAAAAARAGAQHDQQLSSAGERS